MICKYPTIDLLTDCMNHRNYLCGLHCTLRLHVPNRSIILHLHLRLDSSAILEMLSHSAMGSPLTTAKGKLMESENFSPNFQVYLQQKDLRLALQLADELDFAAPITAATNAQYLKAKSLGYANSDFAAVAAAYTDNHATGRSK